MGDACLQFRFVSRAGWVLETTDNKLNGENLFVFLWVKLWGQVMILSSLYILIFCVLQQICMIRIISF